MSRHHTIQRALRYIALTIVLLSLQTTICSTEVMGRKKVAVVLSGGGAKGMAHIGVLRILERAGIPIDIVTGTSMGSIVGGLYAIGYDAAALDSMVRHQDWSFLLSDKAEAHSPLLHNRQWQNTYMLSKQFLLHGKKVTTGLGGFIEGRNLNALFRQLTATYADSISFDSLPRQFACVATDIISNTEYVFHSGSLAEAMRSSMAIPGVFSPIHKGEMVLVDGGLRNNFPVDVALAMGADVVIGVTVQGTPKTANDIKNTSEVISQIVDVNCKNKYDDNLRATDIAIRVNTRGYSSASFSTDAIDTLIHRGESEALAHWDEIMKLKQELGIDSAYHATNIPLAASIPLSNSSRDADNETHPNILLAALGVRFDTEEMVALQLNATLTPRNSAWNIGTTLRLGKRILARADLMYKPLKTGSMTFSYIFRHDDINFYEHGDRAFNITYNQHTIDLAPINFNIRNFMLAFGARFDDYIYNEVLSKYSHQPESKNELLLSYYASLKYNSENTWLFPSRGARFEAYFRYNTDNFVEYNGHSGFSELSSSWRIAIPLSQRFTLQPMLYGRMVFGREYPLCRANVIGGNAFSHYLEQQIPFAGTGYAEFAAQRALALQLGAYERIARNNYIALYLSALRACEKLSSLFDTCPKIGAQLGYCYTSMFGPLGASVGWSTLTHSPYFNVSLGFSF